MKNKKKKNDKDLFIIKKFLIGVLIVLIVMIIYNTIICIYDKESFHSVSLKDFVNTSNKTLALREAYDDINNSVTNGDSFLPTSLNLAKIYKTVELNEDKQNAPRSDAPVPVLSDEEKETEIDNNIKSTAFQIFERLQNKYLVLNQSLNNLVNLNPVSIVRQYHYDGYSIIGKYNPQDSSHVKGKRHTYFIPNFSNVNISYVNGDDEPILEDNNIKDIMSMASVYSYYHDPYDYTNFVKHAYDLFDNSYSYVASISEVYFCTGCMSYIDDTIATDSEMQAVSLDKIVKTHETQKVDDKSIPYKAGILHKMSDNSYIVNEGDYNDYRSRIFDGENVSNYNYCPGHIDLNVVVKVLTIDSKNSLAGIDINYGNKGLYFNKNWHGWDKLMLSRARELSYKDWESEYDISISYIDFVKPLTQEEINYYMNRLPEDITPNRKKVVETALRSVGKIPYYYGGKTSRFGYETNDFGTKVPADYKGRCLKGLDCSGWVNWVYMTAFNKYIIKSEGTVKLASEGTRIKRSELLPGDIIVRPGIDSHVMMFLEWAPGGKICVIHENGSVNNVSIATFDGYFPHYRRIINT